MMTDKIIIGAGMAGITAAIYALRAGKSIVLLECESMGGQITLSPMVENYPGFTQVSGMELADRLIAQLMEQGGEITFGKVKKAEKTAEGFRVETEDGESYEGRSLVLATGASHRHLGVEREEELIGKGVSYCAVCDGNFYRDKVTAIVGGGSAALQDALYLSSVCRTVYLIHRRDSYRAELSLVKQVEARENIVRVTDSRVTALLGEKKISGIRVTNVKNESVTELAVDGLFVAIGMEPHNGIYASLVDLDENGYIIAGEDCRTSCPGIYAAGDCRTKTVRQLTTAAADGTICGLA